MDDFDALYEIMSDAETMQHYPAPFDEARTGRWIEWNLENYARYGFGLWAVVLKETGEFIGDCGITIQNIDGEKLPEIGYHIHKKFWRHGYAKEAAKAVRDWAFENTDYPSIYNPPIKLYIFFKTNCTFFPTIRSTRIIPPLYRFYCHYGSHK